MKKLFSPIVFILIFFMPLVALAQGKEENKTKEPATKLESFLAKKGKLLVKNFIEIGEVAGRYGSKVEIRAVVIYEPGMENQKIRGIKIDVTEGGRYEKDNTSFLDIEEIESLSSALEYMANVSEKWRGIDKEYSEVVFSTKDDFKIGFYQKGIEQAAVSSSGNIGKASCFFQSLQDLTSVKTMVDKGLRLLSEK